MADPVAEVLAEHQEQANDAGTIQCQYGRFETTYPSRMAAHQADALRAKGLVPERVAWLYGVQTGPDTFYPCPSRESALSELALRRAEPDPAELPHLRLVRSPVYPRETPWRTADEGSE